MENNKLVLRAGTSVGKSTACILSALANQDKYALSKELKQYKLPNGALNYPAVLSIPHDDRLWGLVDKLGLEHVHKLIGAAITVASEAMNLRYGLTAEQIFEIVDQIMDSSTEDYLGLEDILLFLQKLVRGEAGKVFDRLDVPKFMELLEEYRENRHQALKLIRYEQNQQFKAIGSTDRTSARDQLEERMAEFSGRLSDLKEHFKGDQAE